MQHSSRRGVTRMTLLLIGVASALGALALGALLRDITRKQDDARDPYYRVVALTDTTTDAAEWGKNFPLHYDRYLRTADMSRTRFGGSEAMPRQVTALDSRAVVAQSRLAEDPRLVTMWDGYAFAKDFREDRGHAYMLTDQVNTERQLVAQQPGTCINCHASTYAAMIRLGNGDVKAGFAALNARPYREALAEVGTHPVSCVDCHDPGSMALRITRPAFMEGIAAYKASQGVRDYDVNTQATRGEMRTFVCAQCHVEYYFQGPEKRLTYPWANGITGDAILAYYQQNRHQDWQHARTGASVLKAQHPEFEMYSQGIHARSGVTCADCHMPFERVGAQKISDHHVQSPVLMIDRACQTCHRLSEGELRQRVETIQGKTYAMRNIAMDALMALIADLEKARAGSPAGAALAAAQDYQRQAQFLVDFVEAENSLGFHAPQEAARLLQQSVDYSRKGQLALRPLATTPARAQERR
ncbi:MAG: ammonia-forming cytochrome c nitrite reductase subunit c552 [Gemmatimonadetes bacterium]|nr:ammonia-forming cytochrome c nitrite reductase subunit c552 [Gemmatimonadota bacterium]